jgi:hypothetical protein
MVLGKLPYIWQTLRPCLIKTWHSLVIGGYCNSGDENYQISESPYWSITAFDKQNLAKDSQMNPMQCSPYKEMALGHSLCVLFPLAHMRDQSSV